MKKWGWVFVLAAVVLAVAVPVISANDKAEVTYGVATIGDIEVGLELVGQTTPVQIKTVLLTSDGIVSELCVKEGDKVSSGEKIASVTPAVSEEVVETMAGTAMSSSGNIVEDIKKLAKTVGCDINTFNACVGEAEKSTEVFSQNVSDDIRLSSPISGKVMSVGVSEGSYAAAGMTAAVIADTSDCIIEAAVYEDDIDKVYIGMPAEITVEGKNETVSGTVNFISDSVTHNEGLKNHVIIKIKPDEKLSDILGRSVKAVLGLKSAKDVLMVPCDAVKNGTVYVIKDGIIEKRSVTTGITDGINTQITEGLYYLEEVVVLCDEELSENMAVEKIDRA